MALLAAPSIAKAGVQDRLYDFTDAYYRQNGINPAAIDNLFSKGYITKTIRPLSDTLRYSVCPVVKDPRNGGIAKDQFLAITRKADGTVLEPEFLQEFTSLQTTGQPAN